MARERERGQWIVEEESFGDKLHQVDVKGGESCGWELVWGGKVGKEEKHGFIGAQFRQVIGSACANSPL